MPSSMSRPLQDTRRTTECSYLIAPRLLSHSATSSSSSRGFGEGQRNESDSARHNVRSSTHKQFVAAVSASPVSSTSPSPLAATASVTPSHKNATTRHYNSEKYTVGGETNTHSYNQQHIDCRRSSRNTVRPRLQHQRQGQKRFEAEREDGGDCSDNK